MAADADVGGLTVDMVPRPVKTYHTETYSRLDPAKTSFDAKGKTVLITGGATGVGLSIARSFAEAGVARIVIVSREAAAQEEAKAELERDFVDIKVELYRSSITDKPAMTQILNQVAVEGLDILVLNAAAVQSAKTSFDLPISEVEDSFATNVIAGYEIMKAYLGLPPPPSGIRTVINVSSCAVHLQLPYHTAYSASKAAFTQIMSAFAAEHSIEKDNLRIFNVHPGAFYTKTVARNYPKDALPWEDIKLPGHFCVWLASPEADFLHGRFVWAEWDVDELIALKPRLQVDPFFLKIGLAL